MKWNYVVTVKKSTEFEESRASDCECAGLLNTSAYKPESVCA